MNTFDFEELKEDTLKSMIRVIENANQEYEGRTDEEVFENEEGELEFSYFFGNWLTISPSGKYYLPFANSNVDGCPTCNWKGTIENPDVNISLWKSQREVDQNTRIHVMEIFGPWAGGEWPQYIQDFLQELQQQTQAVAPSITCPTCLGLGSAEAMADQVFVEAIEEALEETPWWYHAGEGDPLDMIISRLVDDG